ncbi:MAG TPA: hypothetical protein VGG97_29090 [Bryobacteraceae bacterium]|jgi:hypothetical protein
MVIAAKYENGVDDITDGVSYANQVRDKTGWDEPTGLRELRVLS